MADAPVSKTDDPQGFARSSLALSATPAPVFTPDEVASLNGFQESGMFHPFTCGTSSLHRDLVAAEDGWHCPECDYRQDWAHDFMKNWNWKKAVDLAQQIGEQR